jgi:tellurite resistance protein
VLRWCREVAAADGEPGAAETEMLNDVARVLGGK